jgi:hypothetical protein
MSLKKSDKENIVPPYIVDAFFARISTAVELYENSRASKKSLQTQVDRELNRLRKINDNVVPLVIKDFLNEKGLKY